MNTEHIDRRIAELRSRKREIAARERRMQRRERAGRVSVLGDWVLSMLDAGGDVANALRGALADASDDVRRAARLPVVVSDDAVDQSQQCVVG